MILYFSGSGNTQLIANCLNEYLNDEIVSLNDVIKNRKDLFLNSKKPFVFIAPIYA